MNCCMAHVCLADHLSVCAVRAVRAVCWSGNVCAVASTVGCFTMCCFRMCWLAGRRKHSIIVLVSSVHEPGTVRRKLLLLLHCALHCTQGLGTAVLAAILGSLPKTGGSLADHTVLLSGEAAAAVEAAATTQHTDSA